MSAEPAPLRDERELVEVHRCLRPARTAPDGAGPVYVAGESPGGPDRARFEVAAGGVLDLGTYAAGFPAAGWHRLTGCTVARVRARLGGSGRLTLHAVDPAGDLSVLASWEATGEQRLCEHEFRLDGDAQWLWLRAEAGARSVTVEQAGFWVRGHPRPVVLGAAVTTMDRPDSCLELLRTLGELPDELLARVVVVDHGATRLADRPEALGATGLGHRLEVVAQPNAGGSGGFSRGMAQLLDGSSQVTHVALLDDDICLDPESLRRAAALAALGFEGLIGAQMLYTSSPTLLHSTGEVIDPRAFIWRTPAHGRSRADLDRTPMAGDAALRVAHRVDFSGWWMCLVPAPFLRSHGLAMPFFIKWDDVELGLRARDAGVATCTFPGVAVWHVPWVDKDTAVDWQVFFLVRNRLVTAALHGPRVPVRLLLGVAARAAEHLVTMAYGAADLSAWAIEEFLAGPDALLAAQRAGIAPVRERVAGVAERLARRAAAGAEPAGAQPVGRPVGAEPVGQPVGPVGGATVVPPAEAGRRGAAALPAALLRAFVWAPRRATPVAVPLSRADVPTLGVLDAAYVSSASGATTSERRRDRALARRELARILVATARAAARWPALRRAYRGEQGRLTSPGTWEETFTAARG
ncbi:MAG TPA: glycosyltransferase [Intrasporangium sp.]|uniref:glycosyltransferase n=1 Tax=Intrasporangium sp. TaxID=1925024 RepID=UPI002D782509|nr:glycosyltransferase [Intrasporangium sp.]HET7399939.1 glycosyltransferase [Intrasporangium sp.]